MLFVKRQRPSDLSTDLGTVFLRLGYVTDAEVAAAAKTAQASGKRIGEVLVEEKILTLAQVEEALQIQQRLRSGKDHPAEVALDVAKRRAGIDMRVLADALLLPGSRPRDA